MFTKGMEIYLITENDKNEIIDIVDAVISKINKNDIKININKKSYDILNFYNKENNKEYLCEITEEFSNLKKSFDYEKEVKSLYLNAIKRYSYVPEPNRKFEIGDITSNGEVIKTFDNGLFYLLKSNNNLYIYPWIYLWKKETVKEFEVGSRNTERIAFYNQQLMTLLFKVYCDGVDFDIDYQRDYVWTIEDKIDLIDSIFNHIEIGKFVFIETPNKYEILDGKQRLTALKEFFEDNFKYKDKYFSELSVRDKELFMGFNVSVGEVQRLTQLQKLQYFRKLNSKGVVMSKEHLNKIDDMIQIELNKLK